MRDRFTAGGGKYILLFSVLFLTTISTGTLFSQNRGKYPALLWQISGNGLSKPSYLYGTMHVSNKLAFHLSDSFFIALKSADIIALETNPEEWLTNMKDMGMFSAMESGGYANIFSGFGDYGDFYKTAFGFDIPENKELREVLAMDPDLVNGLLYRSYESMGNHEENTYLDLFIFQSAKKLDKQVTSLEDFKESEKMVQEAMIPDPDEEDAGNFYRDMFGRGNVQELIEDAYRRGDLDALDSLSRLTYPSKKYEKYMLHLRNEIMARGMDSIMRRQVLFTGIGAAHLPGEKGVIEMLRKKGYTVRPVSYKVTKKSIKEKEKIEKTVKSLSYVTQFAPDSSFKMVLPGSLIETNSSANMRYYLYPDMVNGAYFMVIRITTFASFLGQTQDYTMKRIDSLLYESIPGKITKNTRITGNNGWPGYDISNVTRRGDMQHYKIFAGPQEIFIFKIGGTGEIVKNNNAEKFLNSIEFIEKKKTGWAKFTPPTGGYSVELPQNVMYEKINNTKTSGRVEKLQAYDTESGDFFLVQRAVYNDFDYIEEDTFELNMFATRFADKKNLEFVYRKINAMKSGKAEYPYLETKLKNKNDGSFIYMNVYLKGPHYFLLATRTGKDATPSKFFNSFRFEDYKFSGKFKEHKDSTMFFTVNDEFSEKDENLFSNLMKQSMNMFVKKEKKKKDTRYQEISLKKNYYSPSSNENIEIDFFKFNDYAMLEDKKKYLENQVKYLAEDNSMIIKEKREGQLKNGVQYDLLLTDTASSRGVKARIIFKDGAKWTLKLTLDTADKLSYWADNFFKTFKPSDSAIGIDPFLDKTDMFLENIMSADTAKRESAENSGYWITVKKERLGEIMKLIEKPEFSNFNYNTKVSLFDALRGSADDKVIAFLQKQYAQYSDSANMQFTILSVLASQQKESASKAFVDLLIKETPLTNNDYDAGSIFSPFYDSLEFAKPLFPALLDLTKFQEYKSSVYSLMAALSEKNLLPAASYTNQKALILNEGNYELKRFNANEENFNGNANTEDEYSGYDAKRLQEEIENQIEQLLGQNMNTKRKSPKRTYSYFDRNDLENYALLLIPFYSSDASVKTFIDKLSKTKNDNLLMSVSLLMLKNKIPVHDSVWTRFSSNEKTRLELYSKLKEIKRLDKFDNKFKSQEQFCRATLYGMDDRGYNEYAYGMDETAKVKKDSIEFITKKLVKNKYAEGYVYFFKRKTGDSKKWKLDYAGLQPKDQKEVDSDFSYQRKSIPVYEDKSMDEQIEEIVEELSLVGRKRAQAGYGGWNSYGGYE